MTKQEFDYQINSYMLSKDRTSEDGKIKSMSTEKGLEITFNKGKKTWIYPNGISRSQWDDHLTEWLNS